jgi:hypothetical protein
MNSVGGEQRYDEVLRFGCLEKASAFECTYISAIKRTKGLLDIFLKKLVKNGSVKQLKFQPCLAAL